ncbi:hypothetical protein [Chengkuizengella axinellae]|uniref:DUF2653 family protein n=1 Tax=Chengkuizengella axinellae TaxID=3064388 RepID=A0ABT9J2G1_9BACL|nr:hypothetical protein [Chengkuizengella sp. 2205SS18-9]MDP5275612.1 hypothetical protein [Chengkuizengella sp. 2205SS18-9]
MFDFRMEICFIQNKGLELSDKVKKQISELFGTQVECFLETKEKDNMEITTTELRGKGNWENEEQLISYIEEKLEMDLLTSIYGYTVQVFPNKKGCLHCG